MQPVRLCIALLVSLVISSVALAANVRQVDIPYQKFVLDNGLPIIAMRLPSSMLVVTLGTTKGV